MCLDFQLKKCHFCLRHWNYIVPHIDILLSIFFEIDFREQRDKSTTGRMVVSCIYPFFLYEAPSRCHNSVDSFTCEISTTYAESREHSVKKLPILVR